MIEGYIVGEVTKEKIFKISKMLFYQKGFKDTKIDEISANAKVNRALISYHFKDKKNLGFMVYRHIIDDFYTLCTPLCEHLPIEEKAACYIFLSYRLLRNYSVTRFITEIQSEEIFSEEMVNADKNFFYDIMKKYDMISPHQYDILSHLDYGIEKEIIRMVYFNNAAEYIDEMVSMELHLILGYCGCSSNQIDDIISHALIFLNNYTIEMKEDFEIIISEKDQPLTSRELEN